MKYKYTRVFFVGAYEKEEKWINEMAAKGLNLVDTTGIVYTFQDGNPGEYIYRLQMLDKHAHHIESIKYIQFLEDTGAECIATYMKWIYLRKKKADGEFEIYSDSNSKLNHYKRIMLHLWLVSIVPLSQIFLNLSMLTAIREYSYFIVISLNAPMISVMIVLLALIHLTAIPVYKAIRRLKNEIKIHE